MLQLASNVLSNNVAIASAFIQYALTRGEGVVKKSMLCTLAKKLKIVDHPLPKEMMTSIIESKIS